MILVDFPIVNDYGYKGNDDEVTLKKSWCRDLKTQKELEAHLFRFRSTNEYYKCAQYEPQTLPYVWVKSDNSFRWRAHLTKASIGFGWRLRYSKILQFMFIFWKQKFVMKKTFFWKQFFLSNQSCLKSVWFQFESNPTSITSPPNAYLIFEKWSKMSHSWLDFAEIDHIQKMFLLFFHCGLRPQCCIYGALRAQCSTSTVHLNFALRSLECAERGIS